MIAKLTHPDLAEAALAQFDLQSQGLPGNLPGILSQSLGLRLHRGANRGQPVAEPVGVLCDQTNGISTLRYGYVQTHSESQHFKSCSRLV